MPWSIALSGNARGAQSVILSLKCAGQRLRLLEIASLVLEIVEQIWRLASCLLLIERLLTRRFQRLGLHEEHPHAMEFPCVWHKGETSPPLNGAKE